MATRAGLSHVTQTCGDVTVLGSDREDAGQRDQRLSAGRDGPAASDAEPGEGLRTRPVCRPRPPADGLGG